MLLAPTWTPPPQAGSQSAAAVPALATRDYFDIFINAHEHEELTLGLIKRMYENPDHATYEVHFTNNDDEQKVRLLMVKAGATWKITDVQYAKDLTLSGMLK